MAYGETAYSQWQASQRKPMNDKPTNAFGGSTVIEDKRDGTPNDTVKTVDTGGGASEYEKWLMGQQTAAAAAERAGVIATIKGVFAQYNLSSLYGRIEEYVTLGLSADAITLMLRETPEYAARFPAMKALNAKGRGFSESDYIGYERTAASLEQRYGVPDGMLMGQVTTLLTGEVSAAELQDRMTLYASDSLTAPQDLRDQISRDWGVDPVGALIAYYADPDIAMPLLEKQSAVSRIGVQAVRQGLNDIATADATALQEQGITESQAQQGFGVVKEQQGFRYGKGETATEQELTSGVFGNVDAAEKAKRIAKTRTGAFQQGGGFASGKEGTSGLGSATR